MTTEAKRLTLTALTATVVGFLAGLTTGGCPRDRTAPTPPTRPAPAPVWEPARLFVVVVEETADLAAGRGALFGDPAVRQRFAEKKHVWRVVDKDVHDAAGNPPADVARFLNEAAGKPYPSLFLVDEAGRTRFAGPLPADPAKLLELITSVGG